VILCEFIGLVLLLARLMGQYCFARWCLSASVIICNAAGRRVGGPTVGRAGGRHSTAGQSCYVQTLCFIWFVKVH